MRTIKIIMSFALALALTACGDDEPKGGGGSGEYGSDVPFPELGANHKRIKGLKREYSNGLTQTLTATYDRLNHLTAMTMTTEGPTNTSETITINYGARTIEYKQSIRTTSLVFELDSHGRLTHVGNPRSSSQDEVNYNYDSDGNLVLSQSSTTNFVEYSWFDHNLMRFSAKRLDWEQQVAYTYSTDTANSLDNKGGIDLVANIQSPFNSLVTMVLRSEGLIGNVSGQLPIGVSTKTQYTGQEPVSKSSAISYTFDASGFVTGVSGYDNVNDLSYKLTVTYAN